jgi:hypothetical protein
MPSVTRVCDGNPDAVKRSESSNAIEDASSSATCPANQIGYVLKKREVTTTKHYACIEHSVQLADTTVSNGPWLEEKFCKDYAPSRCSKDNLTEAQSKGRYQWMKRCASQVPMLRDFLSQYDNSNGVADNLKYKGNLIYASFMDSAFNPEKRWIAPTTKNASCTVPTTVYVSAICVVDCATPEQPVMAAQRGGKFEYLTFENAWNKQFEFVATLKSDSTMSTKYVYNTPVDEWIQGSVENRAVIEFTLQSGRKLRVTPGHPLVTSDGGMKEARLFKAGETLTMLGGQGDGIVAMSEQLYNGRVYNVFTKSNDAKRNIIVINGYLSGSAFFGGEGIEYLNRQILRSSLTKGVFN